MKLTKRGLKLIHTFGNIRSHIKVKLAFKTTDIVDIKKEEI